MLEEKQEMQQQMNLHRGAPLRRDHLHCTVSIHVDFKRQRGGALLGVRCTDIQREHGRSERGA
jgi:hypothetical protein